MTAGVLSFLAAVVGAGATVAAALGGLTAADEDVGLGAPVAGMDLAGRAGRLAAAELTPPAPPARLKVVLN